MKTVGIALLIFLGVLLIVGLDRQLGGAGSEMPITPVPTLGPTGCEPDRDALQVALHAYHSEKGKWPTADGQPGDIHWDKLVPAFLPYIPYTDNKCDWQVNSNPEGGACLWKKC